MQVLLFDGLCGFCDTTVQFVLSRDPGGSMRFAPLQGEFAAGIISQHPELQLSRRNLTNKTRRFR